MKNKKGFSLIDAIVAFAIIGLLFLSIYELFIFSSRASYTRARKIEAVGFAQEGIEAVRILRNEGWDDNIATLSNDLPYYLVFSGDQWTLSLAPPPPINNLFTRTILFSAVNRDAGDNISDTGTLDPDTKKITASLDWQERGQGHNLTLETYLTNFLDN